MNTTRPESGFSLIELLVAMGITVGAVTLALTVSSMREKTSLLTTSNELLHASLELMTREIAVSGRLVPVGGIPIPSGAGSVPLVRPSPNGTTLQFPAAWSTLPVLSPGDALGPQVNGTPTDIVTALTVDRAPMCGGGTLDSKNLVNIAPDGSSATVDPALTIDCAEQGVAAGDLIMFEDPNGKSALQMVTGLKGSTLLFASGDPMRLNQRGAAAGTLLQMEKPDRTYPAVRAFRVFMISYYLDTTTNPGRPQLMRRLNLRPDRLIAAGIENLQITYDFEDGVTRLVNVATPPTPNSAIQLRRANVFISGRSRRPLTRSRQFLRTSMSTQVNLSGLAFAHRYDPSSDGGPAS